MRLELESGKIIERPTADDLRSAIPVEDFVILSTEDQRYIQCAVNRNDLVTYVMEYRDGGEDEHYEVATPIISVNELINAFQKYLVGDTTWKTDFQWIKIPRERFHGPAGHNFLIVLAVIVVVLGIIASALAVAWKGLR